jgi:hypothetical protein
MIYSQTGLPGPDSGWAGLRKMPEKILRNLVYRSEDEDRELF